MWQPPPIQLSQPLRRSRRLRLGRREKKTPNAESDRSRAGRPTLNAESEGADISFFAQSGDPAFLKLLRFVLDQFFLDIGARFGE